MKLVVSLVTGFIFGTGLILSGMIDPLVVEGFLDLFGSWNIALLGVMLSAIPVFSVFYFIFRKTLQKPFYGDSFTAVVSSQLDGRLISGAILFGIGWGLGGVCPGPGFVVLATLSPYTFVFMGFMVLGMKTARKWRGR